MRNGRTTSNGNASDDAAASTNGHGWHTPSQRPTNDKPNGSGIRTGNGGRHRREPPPSLPTGERGRRLLRIAVRETDDEAADRRRLNELVQTLRAIPGDDEVRLTVRTMHDDYELSLGRALVTDGIEQRLRAILEGWGELAVTPLAPSAHGAG